MDCDECRELTTHTFRSPDDLIRAVRLAAEEVDRGVLRRIGVDTPGAAEQEALASVLECGSLPDAIRYRFACEVCGAAFTLYADTSHGHGGWLRDADAPA
jgi:hypothetical protein